MPDIVDIDRWKGFEPFLNALREKHKDNPEMFHAKVEKVLDKWTDIMIELVENGGNYFGKESFIVCDRVAKKVKRIYEGKGFGETFKMWPRTAKIFYQMALMELMIRELDKLQDDGGERE